MARTVLFEVAVACRPRCSGRSSSTQCLAASRSHGWDRTLKSICPVPPKSPGPSGRAVALAPGEVRLRCTARVRARINAAMCLDSRHTVSSRRSKILDTWSWRAWRTRARSSIMEVLVWSSVRHCKSGEDFRDHLIGQSL